MLKESTVSMVEECKRVHGNNTIHKDICRIIFVWFDHMFKITWKCSEIFAWSKGNCWISCVLWLSNLNGFAEPQLDSPLLSCCHCCCRTSCVILKFLEALFSFCVHSSYQGENSCISEVVASAAMASQTLLFQSVLVCFCVFTYIGLGSLYLDSSNVILPCAWFHAAVGWQQHMQKQSSMLISAEFTEKSGNRQVFSEYTYPGLCTIFVNCRLWLPANPL